MKHQTTWPVIKTQFKAKPTLLFCCLTVEEKKSNTMPKVLFLCLWNKTFKERHLSFLIVRTVE